MTATESSPAPPTLPALAPTCGPCFLDGYDTGEHVGYLAGYRAGHVQGWGAGYYVGRTEAVDLADREHVARYTEHGRALAAWLIRRMP